jgi:hypothetical protein
MATAVPTSSGSQPPLSIPPSPPKPSPLAAYSIAVVSAAVMVDIAVEAFLGGSPLRWWIALAPLLYIGTAFLALRMKARLNVQVTIILAFLLGTATATVWLPGGLENGIRFAGQSTARILGGITALALVIAVITILRATMAPLAARIAASVLALYGLAAFSLGAWQQSAYRALFSGHSFWSVLPRWLQGGIVGSLLILPVALLIALCGGLIRGKRNWNPQFVVVFIATIAIAVSGIRTPGQVGDQPGILMNTPPDPQALADDATVLKRIAESPEPSVFSVEKTADQIGNNPASLFAYVHDHVRTQIYRGVLRGARATLMGGAGNAWDQSLLLAAMLRHHGREVRFAHAQLSPEISAKIVDRMFADAARPGTPGSQPVQVPDSVRARHRSKLQQMQKDRLSAKADLLKALDRAGLSLGDSAASEQTLESEAGDHLFVEYHDGDRWVALDPVAAAAPGDSVASDQESFPEIPDAFYHHVTIRVMIEERHNGKLQQDEALQFPTTAAALHGEQVLLSHRFDHGITGEWRATPVLQIGDQAYGARTFREAGLVLQESNSRQDLIGQAHQAVGGLGKVTDLFNNSTTPSSTAPADGFTAEYLDVEFIDPAKHSDTVRREMIDRIGAVARVNNKTGSAPLTPITTANDVPVELTGIYALAFAAGPLNPSLPLRRLSSAEGLIKDAEGLRQAGPSQNKPLSSEDLERLRRVLDGFPVLLQASAESVLAVSQGFAGSLRIHGSPTLFYESTPRLVIASSDLTSGVALDLRRNSLRGLSRKASASELVRANVARSVADAAIEGDVLRRKAEPGQLAAINIFDQARTQHIPLIAVRGGAPVTSLQASDIALARMAGATPGSLLIAPERTPSANPSHFAWWKLDPATGEAISVLDTGLNGFQEPVEEGTIEARVISPMAKTLRPQAFATTVNAGRVAMGTCQSIADGVIEALVELGEEIDLDAMGDEF